jgi:hypothetical protein
MNKYLYATAFVDEEVDDDLGSREPASSEHLQSSSYAQFVGRSRMAH